MSVSLSDHKSSSEPVTSGRPDSLVGFIVSGWVTPLLCGAGLKHKQKAVGYPKDSHDTIALVSKSPAG